MTLRLAQIAERALTHDPSGASTALQDYRATVGFSPQLDAVEAFVNVLLCEFDSASAWTPVGEDPLVRAIAEFVGAICRAEVPPAPAPWECVTADFGLYAFVRLETSMSAGQIAQAEELATRLEPQLRELNGGSYWAWNQVALARSLAFQGRFTQARTVIDHVLADDRRADWPAVLRIAEGTRAFVMAHEGDHAPTDALIAAVRRDLPDPRTYLESAAYILAAFAEQATGRAGASEDLVVHGGGGDYLPRYQVVDRIYGYEVLVESALAREDVAAAQRWLRLAETLPTVGHGMAEALLGRSRARIALALNDPETGERQSLISQERAAGVGGALEVYQAQLLGAAATRAQGSAVDVESLEKLARLAAETGARTVLAWAVRELNHQGRRLRNVPGQGWDALTDRQRLVAALAAQGLRNRAIAEQLVVSERTIEGHVRAVLDLLGAPSRVGIGRHLPPSTHPPVAPGVPGAGAPGSATGPSRPGLTPRQEAVARLIAEGRSNAAIAACLEISEKTVEKHVADLFVRLRVSSRAAVAAQVRAWSVTAVPAGGHPDRVG